MTNKDTIIEALTMELCLEREGNLALTKRIDELRQALAEPANSTTGFVEPVAWIEKHKDYLAVSADPFENAIPVYTTPPKREWVGLTDEERHDIREWQEIQKELGPVWAPMMLYLYVAIEAKLKEKNT
jgi:hypothetical protein